MLSQQRPDCLDDEEFDESGLGRSCSSTQDSEFMVFPGMQSDSSMTVVIPCMHHYTGQTLSSHPYVCATLDHPDAVFLPECYGDVYLDRAFQAERSDLLTCVSGNLTKASVVQARGRVITSSLVKGFQDLPVHSTNSSSPLQNVEDVGKHTACPYITDYVSSCIEYTPRNVVNFSLTSLEEHSTHSSLFSNRHCSGDSFEASEGNSLAAVYPTEIPLWHSDTARADYACSRDSSFQFHTNPVSHIDQRDASTSSEDVIIIDPSSSPDGATVLSNDSQYHTNMGTEYLEHSRANHSDSANSHQDQYIHADHWRWTYTKKHVPEKCSPAVLGEAGGNLQNAARERTRKNAENCFNFSPEYIRQRKNSFTCPDSWRMSAHGHREAENVRLLYQQQDGLVDRLVSPLFPSGRSSAATTDCTIVSSVSDQEGASSNSCSSSNSCHYEVESPGEFANANVDLLNLTPASPCDILREERAVDTSVDLKIIDEDSVLTAPKSPLQQEGKKCKAAATIVHEFIWYLIFLLFCYFKTLFLFHRIQFLKSLTRRRNYCRLRVSSQESVASSGGKVCSCSR